MQSWHDQKHLHARTQNYWDQEAADPGQSAVPSHIKNPDEPTAGMLSKRLIAGARQGERMTDGRSFRRSFAHGQAQLEVIYTYVMLLE